MNRLIGGIATLLVCGTSAATAQYTQRNYNNQQYGFHQYQQYQVRPKREFYDTRREYYGNRDLSQQNDWERRREIMREIERRRRMREQSRHYDYEGGYDSYDR